MVEAAFVATNNLRGLDPDAILRQPAIIEALRMVTAPPIAHDRLVGLAEADPSVLKNMEEKGRLPPKLWKENQAEVRRQVERFLSVIARLLDRKRFAWLGKKDGPSDAERDVGIAIITDRLTYSRALPLIRNEQENRQKEVMRAYFVGKGYTEADPETPWEKMMPGTFAVKTKTVRLTFTDKVTGEESTLNIPVDTTVMPKSAKAGSLPVFIEAKSAGDFTNVNKRRKEESDKTRHMLASIQGRLVLFLGGYFDETYLEYTKREGMDWVWEHRVTDFDALGI